LKIMASAAPADIAWPMPRVQRSAGALLWAQMGGNEMLFCTISLRESENEGERAADRQSGKTWIAPEAFADEPALDRHLCTAHGLRIMAGTSDGCEVTPLEEDPGPALN